MDQTCFHCGLPVPANAQFPIRTATRAQPACCAGCQAVAQTIIDAGLGEYYRYREASGQPADSLPSQLLDQIALYDSDSLQRAFVHIGPNDIREATLLLEGMTCTACAWLIEHHLKRLPGLQSVDIHYSSHRALVSWNNLQTPLSTILQSICAIGYRAHPYDRARQDALRQQERKQAINRLWVAGLSMMQVMMYAVPVYLAGSGEIEPRFLWMLHWASCLLTLPVMLYSAQPFYQGAWRDLKHRRVGMDTPVALGILTAFGASTWALWQHNPRGIYFDSVSMFVFLLLGGRFLEGMARRKAGEAQESLVKLVPAFAHRLADWPASRQTEEVAVSTLCTEMTLLIRPGETIPADAEVLGGISSVNESWLTGESRPVCKQAGDDILAGSVNLESELVARIVHSGTETRLAAITRLLDHALGHKPRVAVLADRFASLFVAFLLLAAVGSFLVWRVLDPDRALWIMVSVLVVSCPCALSLATPAALTAAGGHLAQRGILVTRADVLEVLPLTTDVVFDKTGTLTDGAMHLGAMRVTDAQAGTAAALLAIAQTLESGSAHPLAQAILRASPMNPLSAEDVRAQPGRGVEGYIDGECWRLGRLDFVCAPCTALPADAASWQTQSTVVSLANSSGLVAQFALTDAPRAEAADTIAQLQSQGLRVHLLSGDHPAVVAELSKALRCDEWRAQSSPQDKLDYVARLQQQGRHVLTIGDGINDAPVLAASNASIAMGAGTDVARASGDMVLIDNNLSRIPAALRIARKTRRVIRQNLWWAAVYNIAALPLAISGHVTPALASIGMALSSVLVVSNALRLLKRN
jgi:Cu2+-exporting ATPase